jgi:hypothetical protein
MAATAHASHPRFTTPQSLNRLTLATTLHCLTGCGIGEVRGMVIGKALGWSDLATVALAVALAFVFGYSLTLVSLLRSGFLLVSALPIAFAPDPVSIAVMEIVDSAFMLLVPGAMDAGIASFLFWGGLAAALAAAFFVAFPVNRWMIRRGGGHAVVHAAHD